MKNNKKTNIVFLLDETGSMLGIKNEVITGFNKFLKEQQDSEYSDNLKFSLVSFDSNKIQKRYINESIKNVKKLTDDTYQPGALTPLYDAIGQTITELSNKKKVLFVIFTDGYENASKEYTLEAIKALIKEKSNKWEFLYLGADIKDAKDIANSYGIRNSCGVSKTKTIDTFTATSNLVTCYAADSTVNVEKYNNVKLEN